MSPRKKRYEVSGRPPKDPTKKVGTPFRALGTETVALALQQASRNHGIPDPPRGLVSSDIIRLYVFRGLDHDGLMTPELEADPTWDTLRAAGLI